MSDSQLTMKKNNIKEQLKTNSWDQEVQEMIWACIDQACLAPQKVLGSFKASHQQWVYRVYAGHAESVALVDQDNQIIDQLQPIPNAQGEASGIWSIMTSSSPAHKNSKYLIKNKNQSTCSISDPYAFTHTISQQQLDHFIQGNHHRIYQFLGAHPQKIAGVSGVSFCVWAPNASRVNVIGDFNGWHDLKTPMMRVFDSDQDYGLWWIFVPEARVGNCYQFAIRDQQGHLLPYKADPIAFASELAPARASIVTGVIQYQWNDQEWISQRKEIHQLGKAMSVYEVHAGSWRTHADGTVLNYRELAHLLIPYVKALHFTHIEFMPLTEYPFEGSWGYQTLGLFAPTCRYGTAEDLCFFIDQCHQAGIGVLLDWVPGHFPVDEYGLAKFDGTHLYEHEDPRRGFHPDWNTALYQYGRYEVRDFLISSALYWLEKFHFDGIRVDAVASMLYLDYSREVGEWIPNMFGGREHLEAIDFLKKLNEVAYGYDEGILMIAEESTSWPKVSAPTYLGGLGFGRKWNMGWMNDTLRYIEEEPVHRKWNHHLATFGMVYAYHEHFVLPISHDEVVHGKGSLWDKMPGDDWQKLAHLKLYLSFMWTHPGQKLLFMGCEFAHLQEWTHEHSLEWSHLHLLDRQDPEWILEVLSEKDQYWEHTQHQQHWSVLRSIQTLNALYQSVPALHQLDHDSQGFQWLLVDDQDRSIVSYVRQANMDDQEWGKTAVVVLNFTPVPRLQERVGLPAGRYEVVLNTDHKNYGGSNVGTAPLTIIESQASPWQQQEHSLILDLPPLAACILVSQGGLE